MQEKVFILRLVLSKNVAHFTDVSSRLVLERKEERSTYNVALRQRNFRHWQRFPESPVNEVLLI